MFEVLNCHELSADWMNAVDLPLRVRHRLKELGIGQRDLAAAGEVIGALESRASYDFSPTYDNLPAALYLSKSQP